MLCRRRAILRSLTQVIRRSTLRTFSARMSSLPHDVRMFLHGYPDLDDDPRQNKNLQFYSNKRRCQPDNVLISEIHEGWQGDYMTLEYNHGFIQWLFPIQEYGVNYQAQPLQRHEIEAMVADPETMGRVIKSYRLMLDFYGMGLSSIETGLLSRSKPAEKCYERYNNLLRAPHNNLRISRILKSLSELGLERLNAGFVLHVLNEQSERNKLNEPTLTRSMDQWWANCIRNDEERRWIRELINRVRTDEDFVFTRQLYERALERRKETGKLDLD
ncbi:opioid growth factor receptor conserved region-domain-containing protein [Irpex rosettiformis]|uniref:Opioid growth factor receptor conserved region-domain-containing protein n=1 Tax=Irpex rosettiformis TaxID=378272 RepID=A0ACB8U176_9APHY|nr:opioid growth factor receptor conserved region-domain-containing protein [Irpex rosettiformis]